MAAQQSGHIHGGNSVDDARRNGLHAVDDLLRFGGGAVLGGGDDDVLAAQFAAAAFVEHADGFSDAGGVAKKDFQVAAGDVALLGLDLSEKAFRVGAAAFYFCHLI